MNLNVTMWTMSTFNLSISLLDIYNTLFVDVVGEHKPCIICLVYYRDALHGSLLHQTCNDARSSSRHCEQADLGRDRRGGRQRSAGWFLLVVSTNDKSWTEGRRRNDRLTVGHAFTCPRAAGCL